MTLAWRDARKITNKIKLFSHGFCYELLVYSTVNAKDNQYMVSMFFCEIFILEEL